MFRVIVSMSLKSLYGWFGTNTKLFPQKLSCPKAKFHLPFECISTNQLVFSPPAACVCVLILCTHTWFGEHWALFCQLNWHEDLIQCEIQSRIWLFSCTSRSDVPLCKICSVFKRYKIFACLCQFQFNILTKQWIFWFHPLTALLFMELENTSPMEIAIVQWGVFFVFFLCLLFYRKARRHTQRMLFIISFLLIFSKDRRMCLLFSGSWTIIYALKVRSLATVARIFNMNALNKFIVFTLCQIV